MEGSKLIGLLKTFEKEDWTWFRKFLLSPYFNSRDELIPFLDYLRGQAPEFKEKAIQKERVFKKLFPKESYDEKKISYSMNFLLGQAERFLALRAIETQPPLINNYLQKSLVDRQLDKHYKYQYEKSLKSLNKEKAKNINSYFFEYQITEIANEHYANQNFRHYDPNLQATSDTLDNFYILNKIRCFCEMLGRSNVMETSYELTMEKEVTNLIKSKDFTSDPLILTYIEIYYLVKIENAEENFENLKDLLEKHIDNIPLLEKARIYEYATNYCVRQINKNNNRLYYAEQLLNLYLNGVEQGFLLKNNYLSPWHFKNTIKLGLGLKKYDFTEEFIQKYHKKLEEEFQEDALHYNLADLLYRKKEYDKAHSHLIQVQFSDLFYNLGAKAMLLKIYYETNESEPLLALIASFSIYLRRNKKITKDIRERYLNFTSILAKIVRAHKENYPRIVDKISTTARLENRSWLLGICQ